MERDARRPVERRLESTSGSERGRAWVRALEVRGERWLLGWLPAEVWFSFVSTGKTNSCHQERKIAFEP